VRFTKSGFTLIEIIIVVAIIGFLAAIAIPQFQNLSGQAQRNSTKAGLGAVRSALALRYAASATGGAAAAFPTVLGSSDFAGNTPPYNALNDKSGVTALTTTTSGTATHASVGFWFVTNATAPDLGKAGAYSDGTTNTSAY
jgi:prepilin-type N-terminal cleavage/methylation domain-containing protein